MKTYLKLSALALCIGISGCLDKTADDHYQLALEYVSQNKTNEAIIELKNAISDNTENPQYRYLLGQLYFTNGAVASAEKELNLAYNLDKNQEKLVTFLVRALYLNNSFSAILKLNEENQTPLVKFYAAIVDLQDNKQSLAKEKFTTISQLSNDKNLSTLANVYLAIIEKSPEKALEIINKVEISNEYKLENLLLSGRLGYWPNQTNKAIEAYENLSTMMPQYLPFKLHLANAYIKNNQFTEATPLTNSLYKAMPSSSLLNQLKGQIAFHNQNYEQAVLFSEKAIQGNIDTTSNRLIAGVSNYKIKKFEQAYVHLTNISSKLPPGHIAQQILLDLQLKLGYDDQALKTLHDLNSNGEADASFLNMMSQRMLRAGKKETAEELLESSMALNSDDPIEVAKQGLLQLQLNDVTGGLKTLEDILEKNPELDIAEQGLAIAYINQGKIKEALEIAKKWQKEADKSKKVKGLLLEATVRESQQQSQQVKSLLQQVLQLDPSNIPALFKMGLQSQTEKNYQDAFDYYSQVISIMPSHIGAIRSLNILSNEDNLYTQKTITFYNKQIKNNPKNNELKLGQAYVFAAHKQFDAAHKNLMDIAQSEVPLPDIDIIIGDLYVLENKIDNAITVFKKAATKPNNEKALLKLTMAYEASGQISLALNNLEPLLTRFPNNSQLKLLKLSYLIRMGETPPESLLNQLKNEDKIVSNWLYQKSLGELNLIKGNDKEAKTYFEKAYKGNPNTVNLINLYKSEIKLNGAPAALAILENAKVSDPSFQFNMYLADAYIKNGKDEKAINTYLDALKQNPESYVTLNNLSNLLLSQGKKDDALKYIKKAMTINANSPAVLDSYGQVLNELDQHKEALAQFNAALKYMPENIDIQINKAKTLILLNKNEEAKALLTSLKPISNNNKEAVATLLAEL